MMNDGSLRWVAAGDMGKFAAEDDNAQQGFWYDSPAYEPRP
ncbi:MAG: hypothetical protein ACPGYV_00605 [Phycisphaeraceae bacterium]